MISMGLTGGSVSIDGAAKSFELMKKIRNMLELAKSRSVYEDVGFRLLLHDLTSEKPFRTLPPKIPALSTEDIQKAISLIKKILSDTVSIELSQEENHLIKKLARKRGYDYLALAQSFKIYQIGDSDFLRILLQDDNPDYIVFALNTVTDVFINKYRQLVAGESSRSREFFENQVNEAAEKLRGKEDELKAFKEENNIILLAEQIKSVVSQLNEFESLLDEIEQSIETLKASVWKIESKFSSPGSPLALSDLILKNKEIVGLTDSLKKLEQDYLVRRYEYGDNNLDALAQKIDSLRVRIKELIHEYWTGYYIDPQATRQDLANRLINDQIELEMAQARRDVVKRKVEQIRASANSFAPLEANFAQLNREIQVAEQEYMEMLEKLNLARTYESNSLSSTNLKVVERAFPPQYPMASKRKILVILAGMGSFIFGVISIFILEYFDASIRSIRQAERTTDLPAIIGVPKINIEPDNIFDVLNQPSNIEQRLFREALRKLRSHIINSDGDHNVLVITSSKTGEGKSLLTTMLGCIFAIAHHKTLLVDANFKNPSLEGYLKIEARNHLQDVLPASLSLSEAVTKTTIPNLYLLSAELSDFSIHEIGGSTAIQILINKMKESFEFIIFDTPAMNQSADAMEILTRADLSLFIIKAGNTFQEADQRNLHLLKKSNTRFMGMILNAMNRDFLDPIFGEIEKPRSRARVFLKKLFTRQFSSIKKTTHEKFKRT